MRNFRKLDVWKKAHALTLEVYQLTAGFPATERFGLSSQLRRASASIGANLAEGCGRESDPDFRRFVQMSCGSACEVECHLLLAKDLEFLAAETHKSLDARINEIKRMLVGLAHYLKTAPSNPRTVPK